ncbi:MAG: fsr 2 [Firmicutes bacterium]|nr:fsr 2 [Bacillota bacterium]
MTAVADAITTKMTYPKQDNPTTQQTNNHGFFSMVLLTLGHFISDFYNNFLPGLLPAIIAGLGMSLTTSGLLVMVYAITSSITQPFLGYCMDKNGYSWLILFTFPASAVFICTTTLVPNIPVLFAFVILAGIGSALFHPLGSSMMGKITPLAHKGIAIALFIGGGNVGFAIAPAVVIYFIFQYGLDSLPWLVIPAFALTIAYYMKNIHRIPIAVTSNQNSENAPVWYKTPGIIKLNVVMGLRSWAHVAIPTFLPVWIVQQGQSPTLAANMITVFLVGGAIGSVIGGYFGDRFGRKNTILWSLFLCVPALYLFLNSSVTASNAWILLFISGAALLSAMPSSVVWAQEMMPDNAAMASGMMMGFAYGLGGLGAAITGAMADVIGLHSAFLFTVIPLAFSIPLVYSIPKK